MPDCESHYYSLLTLWRKFHVIIVENTLPQRVYTHENFRNISC